MSMPGHLLIKKRAGETLDDFVAMIDTIIGPIKWEERESTNYVNERYFAASAVALKVKIAIADDTEFSDYDHWISIDVSVAGVGDRSFLDGVADAVARAVTLHGYEVLRPNDMSRAGNGGSVYRLNPNAELWSRERIIVETFGTA
jgi:hypothetical protein